jgi:hypothetical protein
LEGFGLGAGVDEDVLVDGGLGRIVDCFFDGEGVGRSLEGGGGGHGGGVVFGVRCLGVSCLVVVVVVERLND